MDKVSKEQKGKVKTKLLELQLKGLQSYAKYLDKEFKNSVGKEFKKAYHDYIAKEVVNAAVKIKKLEEKLG